MLVLVKRLPCAVPVSRCAEKNSRAMAVEDLHTVIKRCQILEEPDFRGEDFSLFQSASQKCLEEGHVVQILDVIQNEKNKVIVRCMGWNLVGPVVRCTLCYGEEDRKRGECLKILDLLVQICNPKELLLGLLELVEEPSANQISQTILLLLQPLQTVILKLPRRKASSVGLALSTLWNQLRLLPVPYAKEQIREDRHGFCRCCLALANFSRPFVAQVAKNRERPPESDSEELKSELLKFCFKSLKYPLLTVRFREAEESEDDPLGCFASEIVGFLLAVGDSLPKVFFQYGKRTRNWDHQDFEEEEDKQLADSMASLSYLVFVRSLGLDQFPTVLSPLYLLQFNMAHVDVLLKRTEESVSSKGLDLLECSLFRLEDGSLLHRYLEIKSFLTVPQDLVKVMTLCPIESLRKKSLKVLQLYIDKLDSRGKYTLFRCLLKTSNHSGVEGYVIQNIKNQIDVSLKSAQDDKWFTGPQLLSLLDLVLLLPEGAETDLLQNSDRIMASLNLLRYLVIKDNANNRTGLWTELKKIEDNFLKPLHTGLNMSRAHYEAEIRSKKENRQESHKSKNPCTLTVGGEKIPNMTPEMQLQALHSALFTFDLIESVLARVEELTEAKTKCPAEENAGVK
ncbi:glomulin isoform X2 [Ornithorhynchus anatinus]|uniref:glomulin isoform X2 n=1 Tax=Ornithorhynchus anatinus TaxID=9258 RepID=UPI0010A82886|nr:glomulin isoform X2 [Ornithorhynchus anatinus]